MVRAKTLHNFLLIAIGAVCGALARHTLNTALGQVFGISFPWGTFWVNMTGCLLIGFLVTFLPLQNNQALEMLFKVGFLSSYTTFSSYALESSSLLEEKDWQKFFYYWVGSPLLGLMFLQLGAWLARSLKSVN